MPHEADHPRSGIAVITLDRDFPQLLAIKAAERHSVVLIRQQRLRAAELVQLMTAIWDEYEDAIEQGCVLMAGARGSRVRSLPLK